MPTFPRFLGGPNLGSNLGLSMTAKASIVGQLLAIIFPGIIVYLIQGSPSGSSASGGTHSDAVGDAGDFVYRYADGRAAGLEVYLMASVLWRMLDCLSYVRGFDVDRNGVKDDTFDQHNHVIDREGDPTTKVQAVKNQIALFAAHLDGLVGGRADREKVFPQPMTLAEYQTPSGRATFLLRFQALSREALGLTAHIEPTQEDDMPRLLLDTQGTGWLVTDRGAASIGSLADAKIVRRVLTATQWDPANATTDRVLPAEIAIYKGYLATANGPAPTATVTATVDAAVLKAAIDGALNEALSGVTFTTRKASA